jgi:hypothetical protein
VIPLYGRGNTDGKDPRDKVPPRPQVTLPVPAPLAENCRNSYFTTPLLPFSLFLPLQVINAARFLLYRYTVCLCHSWEGMLTRTQTIPIALYCHDIVYRYTVYSVPVQCRAVSGMFERLTCHGTERLVCLKFSFVRNAFRPLKMNKF